MYPRVRMRRNRTDAFVRRLVRESTFSTDDLIYPMFVTDAAVTVDPIQSMPGINRYSPNSLVDAIEEVVELGIPCIALFPHIDQNLKDETGSAALDAAGLIPIAVKLVKREFPDLGIITDAALDPYTSHGQDGIIDANGYVLNDESVEILTKQSLVCAEAGADIIAPSDMMDGRIGAIRESLDDNGFEKVKILSYAAKYASAFYGPFRDAVGSTNTLGAANKKTYQMDAGNTDEALREVELDLQEGADMVMVKPGLPYLDVVHRVKETFGVPTFAYQVSGEYSMLRGAIDNGWFVEDTVLEALLSFKRAGADAILTYFAVQAARLMSKSG